MKQKKSKSHLPLRLNLLFFLIFLLFSLLILQLGVVQILYGQNAQEEINRTDQETSKNPVPRGRMFDRTGELMVDNNPVLAITYTPPKNVQPIENLEVAKKLVDFIDMTEEEVDSITERDLKDYWILENHDKAYGRLNAEEEEELDSAEKYQLVLEKVKEEDINNYSEQKLEMIAIFRKLNQASALTPHIIKRGESVTNEEYAIIASNLSKFEGVNVTTDWDREYLVEGNAFKNFIGSITTTDQGIPRAELDYFLSHNYSRNDRVGRSGLEEYYELQLSGQKEIREHITDSSGNVITSEVVREGERGKDLVLSVDLELQKRLDKIVGEELKEAIENNPYENRHMSSAMAIMMEPNTGEILAMSGQTYNRNAEGDEPKLSDESFKVVNSAYQPGSVVKGATVLAGLDSGVISPGEVINDRTIQLPAASGDELSFSSWTRLNSLNDIGALRESSNVYMGFIALRMNGITNHQYDYRNSDMTITQPGFKELRNYYSQFGLGVATGVDLPHESTGYEGTNDSPKIGNRMQYAIGQYHSYTTLQLGQYVSTIANDGYRMAPRLVKQMHNPGNTAGIGPLYEALEPKVLNRVEMKDDYIDRVQEGFRQAFQVQGGTGSPNFADKDYSAAGKTGTAQTKLYEDGKVIANVNNLNLVGYAPYDDPEVSFAVVVPHSGTGAEGSPNLEIGERALDAYFEIRDERASSEESLEEETETESSN